MTTRGMVLGKFLPPHLGHVYLIEFARAYVDELSVVVGTLAREPIDGALRFRWMRELFPDTHVIHLTDENPQYPEEHTRFWDIWRESLQRVLPAGGLDFVFASEDYGQKLAEVLGAEFVPVDIARTVVPISASAIRAAPMKHWRFIPPPVRPHFVKRVCVFGPESTGKTTLTHQLATHFDTVMVPEYARALLERKNGAVDASDIPKIARGQMAAEDALARHAHRVMICDTDLITTTIWSDVLFGACEPWIHEEANRRQYDLYLLTDVDVPWVADPQRYLPDERRSFFERCARELESRGRRFVRVHGDWDRRFAIARDAVANLLDA